jgi:hypothetical protein
MSQYAELDARILKCIADNWQPLYNRDVDQEASRIAKATGREVFRVVDGRLQALRKAGRIKANRKLYGGWEVVPTAPQEAE